MKEKIALGFGDNIDYEIVWNSTVLETLIVQYDIHDTELDIDQRIQSERDLVITILGFLKLGSGGERFIAAPEIIEPFSQRFARKITLGGTSVRAAIAMRKFGYTSALHLVTINDHVRRLIPQDSPYVCSNAQDSSYPHLIVQFGKGTVVGAGDIDICASQANRLIYHSDVDNITMKMNEDFAHLITDARVFLIAGLNAMHAESVITDRLASILRIMESLPKDALVYYEDGGFYEPSFRHLIVRTLARKIHVFSLNEDEMQDYLNQPVDLLDSTQIIQALPELAARIPVPIIVIHTQHWALAYGEDAARFSAALKAGVTMATTRYCYGDDFTVEDYREVESLPPSKEAALLADALNKRPGSKICCVPVAQVERPDATTIGLGDAFVGGFLPALLER
ncbi:MAG: hypothetical protein KC547_17925 [Anaerolineae bacterium]|nr:hypothetical protein [Anaerolineae bacterium]